MQVAHAVKSLLSKGMRLGWTPACGGLLSLARDAACYRRVCRAMMHVALGGSKRIVRRLCRESLYTLGDLRTSPGRQAQGTQTSSWCEERPLTPSNARIRPTTSTSLSAMRKQVSR